MEEMQKTIQRLYDAAYKLYTAGYWTRGLRTYPDDRPDAVLWEEFREAFGIPEGTATNLGVGTKKND